MVTVIETAPQRTCKTEALSLRRGLSLYKQPQSKGRGSPNWYARVYLPVGGRRLHARSTRTTDADLARQRAEEFLTDLRIQQRYEAGGLPGSSTLVRTASNRFDRVAEAWLAQVEREAGNAPRRLRRYRDFKQIYFAKNGLAAFFKRREIGTITTDLIREYLVFATEHSSSGALAGGTKKAHLAVLRHILNHAYEKRMIPSVPLRPGVPQVDNPRSWFTAPEYHHLFQTAGKLKGKAMAAKNKDETKRWIEVQAFVSFMVNSFLRPSEWAGLRHRDIEIIEGDDPHLRIHVRNGKVRPRTVYTMPGAISAYRHLRQLAGNPEPDDLVFLWRYPNRETALAKMRSAFDELLVEAGLTRDEFGEKRVIYCLRHTAIMLRILQGDNVDYLALARNAGTSVEEIDRFYGSHLDAAMKLRNLQSFKKKRR